MPGKKSKIRKVPHPPTIMIWRVLYMARDYLAYSGYGAMPLFQNEIIRGHGNFWSRKKNHRSPDRNPNRILIIPASEI